MKLISLYSGSKGNSTLVSACGTNILIDAGQSARRLTDGLKAANISPDSIDAIFITHEHTDHVSALEVFLKKHRIPVHITEKSAQKLLSKAAPHVTECLVIHPPMYTENIKELTVASFPTPHDSMCSVGFRISFREGECLREIGYATDIGYVTDAISSGLMGCESVVIEANHDVEMLKHGSYPYDLKKRILSKRGHLSNTDCAVFLSELCANGTKNVLLAHLSEENNHPSLAYDEISTVICDPSVNLAIADQFSPTVLVSDEEELCST